MGRRKTTFSRGSNLPSATLNAMQDEAAIVIRATGAPSGTPALTGTDGRHWCTPDAGVPNDQLVVVDATSGLNWRSRRLSGAWLRLETAAQRLQGADSWQTNDTTRPIASKLFERGRTGTGGLGAAAATIANGTPPVIVAGSFAVVIDELGSTALRVYLYARPSDGALCLYNASGATLHGELLVWGSGVSPTAGAPPPSPIPTLTDVLWLDPGLAADRPSDPGGPAIYRSTDTGAIEIWDGGAWRDFSGGSIAVPWSSATDPAAVSTATTSASTVGSRTLATGQAYLVIVRVVAALGSDRAQTQAWVLTESARNVGGTVTVSGSPHVVGPVGPGSLVTGNLTLDASTNTIRARATPSTASQINWTTSFEMLATEGP